jgi:hypothetical protein
MVSELPDRCEILMMCVVTRVGRRLLQRTFHHEGKHIVFDGEAKELDSAGFNYFADLLAEADCRAGRSISGAFVTMREATARPGY